MFDGSRPKLDPPDGRSDGIEIGSGCRGAAALGAFTPVFVELGAPRPVGIAFEVAEGGTLRTDAPFDELLAAEFVPDGMDISADRGNGSVEGRGADGDVGNPFCPD